MKLKDARWMARKIESLCMAGFALNHAEGRVKIRARALMRRPLSAAQHLLDQLHRFFLITNRTCPAWKKLAKFCNARLVEPRGGLEICDGAIECPRCGCEVATMASPQEWTLRRDGRWRVTDYWGGMAECCGLLLYHDFDGARYFELPSPKEPSPQPVETPCSQ